MAAQISPHSVDQITELQRYSQKKQCPQCGRKAFSVRESRKCIDGIRRRYVCDHCELRETRYEVSAEAYNELTELRRVVKEIKSLISTSAPAELKKATQHVICYSCDHFSNHGCGFDYPEAGSSEAEGCINYEKKS